MARMKNASRPERPVSPSSSDEHSSDHSHPTAASPSSLGVFSANSPSSRPSHSSHPSPASSSAPLVDPEYVTLATKVAGQDILKEKPFPLTPATNPFVQQLFQLQLLHLAQPRTSGNLTFVRQFYTNARYSNTYGINFRGVFIPNAFTSSIIREHYHLPVTPRCHYSELINEYPWDDVLHTLCPEGANWSQPRGAQRYIRRADLHPEARPWLHFICNNILPSQHRTMVPKEQALYIYLLMVGRPVNLAQAIVSALRQCILATNAKQYLLFPHLITDLFRAYRVPEHPADLTFQPASPFIYVRVGKPRHLQPPLPPQPSQPVPSPSSSPSPSPPVPSGLPEAPPPVSSPPSVPPTPSEVALLREDIHRLEAQMTADRAMLTMFQAQMTADREFTRSLLTMIAAHLGLHIPPPAPVTSAGPSTSASTPPDPPAADPPA